MSTIERITPSLVLLALAALAPAACAAPSADCLRVEVRNVRAGAGPVLIAAYSSAATFMKTVQASSKVAASAPVVEATLCGLGAEAVAILVYQDLNDNGKLDTGMFGIPTEPTGNSGRPATMGPPTWDASRLQAGADKVVIELTK